MISDLLPSAGDEKRHTKGETELQSFTAKQATLTHTHIHSIPHSPSLPSTLPPLESNRTGCAIVDQVPSKLLHENLSDERRRRRRRRPHLRHLTSTPTPTPTLPPPRYRHPRKERATTAAFRIPVAGIVWWGGKSAPISSAIGRWSPFSSQRKNTRYTPRQPVDRLYQGRHGECTIRCGPAAPDTLFGISSCVDDIDCFGDYFVM